MEINVKNIISMALPFLVILLAVYFFIENERHFSLYAKESDEKEKYMNMYLVQGNNTKQETNLRREQQKELGVCKDELQAKETDNSDLQARLESEVERADALQDKVMENNALLKLKAEELLTTKKEVENIIYNLDNLENFVSSNSLISKEQENKIHSYCGNPAKNCIIDANKMGRDMTKCLGFVWVDDQTTSNFADGQRIFDLNTFWLSKQGDCDDFALYMAAWLRTEYKNLQSSCRESEIRVKVDMDTYVQCPCNFYSIGGYVTKIGGTYHMETGIGQKGKENPEDIYIVEPQDGNFDGMGNGNVMTDVYWLFTKDDFRTYSYDTNEILSISGIKNKLSELE
ncbi:MAG: hypothetical protein ABII22_02200 [Candidatus Micrarchaeota archaeon]